MNQCKYIKIRKQQHHETSYTTDLSFTLCVCVCNNPQTVALEELNSEYIALKRGQDNNDDRSAALMSLRTRYNDIRTKVVTTSAVLYTMI